MTHEQGAIFVRDLATLQKLIGDRIATLEEKAEELRESPKVGEQQGIDVKAVSGMIKAYTESLKLVQGYEQTDRLNRTIEGVLSAAQREDKPAYIRFTYRDTPWIVQLSAITRARVSKPEKPDQDLALEIRVAGEDNTLYIRGKEAEAALKVLPCIDLAALSSQEVKA